MFSQVVSGHISIQLPLFSFPPPDKPHKKKKGSAGSAQRHTHKPTHPLGAVSAGETQPGRFPRPLLRQAPGTFLRLRRRAPSPGSVSGTGRLGAPRPGGASAAAPPPEGGSGEPPREAAPAPPPLLVSGRSRRSGAGRQRVPAVGTSRAGSVSAAVEHPPGPALAAGRDGAGQAVWSGGSPAATAASSGRGRSGGQPLAPPGAWLCRPGRSRAGAGRRSGPRRGGFAWKSVLLPCYLRSPGPF